MKIDFVITWVDGNDPDWLKEKAKYKGGVNSDSRINRYRDWDNLRYWFRSVEKNAPWVNNIFFITCGHYPSWLNLNHPKLVFVKHEDYIPREFLPTFSSRAIDMNFHRIDGLSNYFVYFNDDMFITSKVNERDFFIDGNPCDTAILNAWYFGANEQIIGEREPDNATYLAPGFDMIPINRNFDKVASIRRNILKWISPKYGMAWLRSILLIPWRGFTGFMSYHMPYSYLKSTYSEVWEKEEEILRQACLHKFRETTDVNHWVFSYWQLAKGTFSPRSPKCGKQYSITDSDENNQLIINDIIKQKYKFLCLNDGVENGDFEMIKKNINDAFNKIFPEKSEFEL